MGSIHTSNDISVCINNLNDVHFCIKVHKTISENLTDRHQSSVYVYFQGIAQKPGTTVKKNK